ncbi:expressed unknown protein [Seminavis robusta]|uniref:Uncharacterized protein n=1 Tax=Seminavis robusta TaxID=568900 RepID=A0A9N8EN32_9STRA|nr:expressed unknown protein [Seminavis robusta]|eukprot:Sro1506_g278280.1 n/a (241) ;mRNA; f:13008-13730
MTVLLRSSTTLAALLLLLPKTFVLGSVKLVMQNGGASQCQTLWAKHTIAVGNVCVEADQRNPEQLIVSYETRDGWKLDDAHLWIGRNISEIPFMADEPADDSKRSVQQQQHQDQPYQKQQQVDLTQFPYKKEDLAGKHENFGFVVKLQHLGYSCPDTQAFVAAAHATVTARSSIRNGNTPTLQSAWASHIEPMKKHVLQGATMINRINQWQDFNFTLVCDIKNDPPEGAPKRHFANQVPK